MRARARARCARFETAFHDRCSSWRSFEASTESAFQTVVRYLHCISIRCESELIIHGCYILTCRLESCFYYASASLYWSIHELWIIFCGTKRFYVMSTTTSIFLLYIYSIDGDVILKFQDVFSLLLYYIYNLISI